jgi:hypothetical protein
MVQSVLGVREVLQGRLHEDVCQQHTRLQGLQTSERTLRQVWQMKGGVLVCAHQYIHFTQNLIRRRMTVQITTAAPNSTHTPKNDGSNSSARTT